MKKREIPFEVTRRLAPIPDASDFAPVGCLLPDDGSLFIGFCRREGLFEWGNDVFGWLEWEITAKGVSCLVPMCVMFCEVYPGLGTHLGDTQEKVAAGQ